ncbi:MAG: hypothetical protein DWQ58_15275 [Microcystis aeruginosa TA09]|nr:MAG: hypothetical protein DWQ58_15275 [Microcystis aeruginosa TA09]
MRWGFSRGQKISKKGLPLSNAQKTGFSEKPVFYSCKGQPPLPPDIGGVGGIDNQSLITGFSIKPAKIKKRSENNHSY